MLLPLRLLLLLCKPEVQRGLVDVVRRRRRLSKSSSKTLAKQQRTAQQRSNDSRHSQDSNGRQQAETASNQGQAKHHQQKQQQTGYEMPKVCWWISYCCLNYCDSQPGWNYYNTTAIASHSATYIANNATTTIQLQLPVPLLLLCLRPLLQKLQRPPLLQDQNKDSELVFSYCHYPFCYPYINSEVWQ